MTITTCEAADGYTWLRCVHLDEAKGEGMKQVIENILISQQELRLLSPVGEQDALTLRCAEKRIEAALLRVLAASAPDGGAHIIAVAAELERVARALAPVKFSSAAQVPGGSAGVEAGIF